MTSISCSTGVTCAGLPKAPAFVLPNSDMTLFVGVAALGQEERRKATLYLIEFKIIKTRRLRLDLKVWFLQSDSRIDCLISLMLSVT